MNRFLSVIPVDEAIRIIRRIASLSSREEILLSDSYGRILADDICSDIDIPGFDRSTVDGYAVYSSDTTGAGESIPSMLALTGRIVMGEDLGVTILPGTCMYIPTGGSLPPGADAVVMIEYCEELGDQILIHRPVAHGENVISRGEDFGSDRVAVHTGTRISSRVAGVLAACGADTVSVSSCPRIGIISTGNELVPIQSNPSPGQIRDVNTWLCAGFVTEQGGIPVVYGIIQDDVQSLTRALDEALHSCDAVLISGGSSKGERDMCADIIASRGEVLIHGIAISPGKPTIIGTADGKPVIGLPGHPASAYVILLVIVKELFKGMTGQIGSDNR
ncbi:MAG: molybdopterin molybdenumtransferase MoeA, partial [Methanomicrobiales archaeon HGW-Methanomicrobiales-4]